MRFSKLQEHKAIAETQWKSYHQCMENLMKQPSSRLVIHDFNQQHATTGLQSQVLTLVVYGAPTGFLERHYYNSFLPQSQTNNLTAVVACHRDFFHNPAIVFLSTKQSTLSCSMMAALNTLN
jgi:hypothetical protein